MSDNIKTWPEHLYFLDADYPIIENELLQVRGSAETIEYIRKDVAHAELSNADILMIAYDSNMPAVCVDNLDSLMEFARAIIRRAQRSGE